MGLLPHSAYESLTGPFGKAFMVLINVLVNYEGITGPTKLYPPDYGPTLLKNPTLAYDFVIVGGGTAGCVLANRLSENINWTVLVIEAGGVPSLSSEVPAFYHTVQNSHEDWQHVCAKQKNACLGTLSQSCAISQGKALGGTSTINNLHYTRGNNRDFSNWTSKTKEWTIEDMEVHYKRIEDFQRDEKDEYPIDYGRGGEITINKFKSKHYTKDMIVEAARELKYNVIVEEKKYLGYIETLGMLRDGKRLNMAKAFLSPIKNRTNLFVARHTLATKIIFSDDDKPVGLKVFVNGAPVTVRAKKEIIVTADPVNTAKLLMASGIGYEEELKKFGICSRYHLPVGKNLKTQIALPIYVTIDHVLKTVEPNKETAQNIYEFLLNNKGPYTQININDLLGYINTNNAAIVYPDIQIYHSYFPPNDTSLQDELFVLDYEFTIIRSILKANYHRGLLIFKPTLLHPQSTGEVRLTGICPDKPVNIIGNFFTDKLGIDIDTLVAAYKYVEAVISTEPFQKYNGEIFRVDVPNCRNLNVLTDAYIKCYIKNMAYPRNTIGTARMGFCQFDSVVDSNLTVFGHRGLRVCGASAMPTFVSGNIAGTVAMLGDKLSDLIKSKWIPNYVRVNQEGEVNNCTKT